VRNGQWARKEKERDREKKKEEEEGRTGCARSGKK